MLILALFLAVGAFAQDATACLECHAGQAVYGQSIHKDIACSGCHQTIREFPHPEQENGERSVGRSRIVTMCGRCHGDLRFVEDRRIPGRQLPFINYADSVHGRAVAGGRLEAAICTDCHGSHDARPPSDPQSKVSRSRAHATCGACHSGEFEQYEQSVHGQAHREGQSGAPTCTDCHGIHSITDPAAMRTSDAERALGKTSCSRCHESEVLSREYALPMDRVRSYLDSYHGLAVKRGSMAVANCSSCHGVHGILASSDPASSIHPDNLPQTCGVCHPGASENFARGQVHLTSGAGTRVIEWVSLFYIALIGLVTAGMFIHNALDFRVKLRLGAVGNHDGYFTKNETVQHLLLLSSFVILVASGFALKWPDSLFGLMVPGGEEPRRWIHRIAGVVMIGLAAYHVIFLMATARGRQFVRDFWPKLRDFGMGIRTFRFSASLRGPRPDPGFPGYVEKLEYWALLWGTVIMAATGLLLWFENTTLRVVPLWVLNLLTVIHYYEAVLATSAILVWHIYFVVLDPTVYPLKSLKREKAPDL